MYYIDPLLFAAHLGFREHNNANTHHAWEYSYATLTFSLFFVYKKFAGLVST